MGRSAIDETHDGEASVTRVHSVGLGHCPSVDSTHGGTWYYSAVTPRLGDTEWADG